MTEEIPEINFPPQMMQLISRKLGLYASTYLGNDGYHLLSALRLMKEYTGEEYLKKYYPDWNDKNWKKILRLATILNREKKLYDLIEDKKFEKADKEIDKKREFINKARKVPLIEEEVFKLFIFLVKNSNLKRHTIPNEAFKIIEHTGKKAFELDKKKPQTQETKNE